MRTSYSALATYKICPLKYKYSQIDKIKEPKRAEQVYGTLIHSALKFMFERNPLYPTLDQVIDFYTKKWNEKSLFIEWRNLEKKEAEEKVYFDEGIATIKNFYKKNQPWTFNVVELEGRFSLELTDEVSGKVHTLAGIIDRIDKDPQSDLYEIIDYKTGKRMPAEKDLKENLQLGLYHLALISRWPQLKPENIKTSLYFLKHNEKISVTPTQEIARATKQNILNTIREIEQKIEKEEAFPPTPSAFCGSCGYRKICPMWSHEYKKAEVKTASDKEVAVAIKEFFDIKAEDDTRKKRLADLRNIILSYMEQEKVERVFGGPGYITKGIQERFSYDLEKIKPILEKIGKWNAILDPDEKKLEKLLAQIPKNIKEEILMFRNKKLIITLKPTKKK